MLRSILFGQNNQPILPHDEEILFPNLAKHVGLIQPHTV